MPGDLGCKALRFRTSALVSEGFFRVLGGRTFGAVGLRVESKVRSMGP